MFRKLLECIGAVALLASALIVLMGWADKAMGAETQPIAEPSPYIADGSVVVQVHCADDSSGSAVYLGSGKYITAAHVMLDETGLIILRCQIAGQSVSVERIDEQGDWALVHAAHYPKYRAAISCARLQEGGTYFATGYARGNPWIVTTRLRGAGFHQAAAGARATAFVFGSLAAGSSGGAVADGDGVVLAIIDWRDDDGVPTSGVVELADTSLCKGTKP